ncbi:MAG: YfiR family protein [Spartobacteria bacterium]|nr:YfiR family protein [Spartobacteria bacterium]
MDLLKIKPVAAAFVFFAIATAPFQGAPVTPNEYALKSVFLYNFCHFIEWPDSAFSSPNEPLIIGIVGDDPFGNLLKEAVEGETYHDRPIRIEHYRGPRDIRHCHLLFIGRSEAGRMESILEAVSNKSVVTVGETEDFLERGGMIALPAERNRVRLRINPAALRAASLDVSSKLLRVADLKS